MGGQNCIFHLHHLCVSDNLPPRELFQFPCAQHVSGIPSSRDFVSNAPYVLTDLFHLARMNPYDAATGLMKFDLHLWLYFTNLVISALACCLMGVWSLEYVTQTLQVRFRKPGLGWRTIIVTVLTIFSSVGVYVGRFLRLHTAYLFFDPGFVIKELITMWSPRMLAFVFMMFLLQMTVWVSITIGRITITNLDSKYNLQ